MNSFSKPRIQGAVVVLLASVSALLAAIDPDTRPAFGDLAKVVLVTYIGTQSPKENDDDNDR
jgi:hypothetical protein